MYDWIIVDGNNLLHSDSRHLFGDVKKDFQGARWGLARALDELSGVLAPKVTIIYDGTIGGRDEVYQASSLEVVFSPGDKTADTVIERLVAQAGHSERILVVSSDREERNTVNAAGAMTMSCRNFIDLVDDTRRSQSRGLKRAMQASPKATLGDFFPAKDAPSQS